MPTVPAYCHNCGLLFAGRAFFFGNNASNITLKGNKEDCPRCHQMADILDGTFDVINGALTAISAPEFTLKQLRQFSSLVGRASRNEINPEDLETQAAKIDPQFGEIVKQIKTKGPYAVVLLILLTTMLKSCHFDAKVDAKVDINQLFDQILGVRNGITYKPPVPRDDKGPSDRDNSGGGKRPATTVDKVSPKTKI